MIESLNRIELVVVRETASTGVNREVIAGGAPHGEFFAFKNRV